MEVTGERALVHAQIPHKIRLQSFTIWIARRGLATTFGH